MTDDTSKPAAAPDAPSVSRAPWTEAEVSSLNHFQKQGCWHPFTCECGRLLIAASFGWFCGAAASECGYTQTWAWKYMSDGSWEEAARTMGTMGGD